jgi:hypothetical protein
MKKSWFAPLPELSGRSGREHILYVHLQTCISLHHGRLCLRRVRRAMRATRQPPLLPSHYQRHKRPDLKDRSQHLLPKLPGSLKA